MERLQWRETQGESVEVLFIVATTCTEHWASKRTSSCKAAIQLPWAALPQRLTVAKLYSSLRRLIGLMAVLKKMGKMVVDTNPSDCLCKRFMSV